MPSSMLRTRYTHLNTRLIHSAQALLIAGMMLLASGPAHALTLRQSGDFAAIAQASPLAHYCAYLRIIPRAAPS